MSKDCHHKAINDFFKDIIDALEAINKNMTDIPVSYVSPVDVALLMRASDKLDEAINIVTAIKRGI